MEDVRPRSDRCEIADQQHGGGADLGGDLPQLGLYTTGRVAAPQLREASAVTVDKELKNIRSVGRLHGAHIHRESEAILIEIARERGFADILQSTHRSLLNRSYFDFL